MVSIRFKVRGGFRGKEVVRANRPLFQSALRFAVVSEVRTLPCAELDR